MQSEKLKALSAKWRDLKESADVMAVAAEQEYGLADLRTASHIHLSRYVGQCADELDAELAALVAPSPAPPAPLRDALGLPSLSNAGLVRRIELLAQGEFTDEWNKGYKQATIDAARIVRERAALDSTKASEPALGKEKV